MSFNKWHELGALPYFVGSFILFILAIYHNWRVWLVSVISVILFGLANIKLDDDK